MDDTPIGTSAMFYGESIPEGWMRCSGQVLNVSDYPDLYAAIGGRFGGDSMSTFALPNVDAVSEVMFYIIKVA